MKRRGPRESIGQAQSVWEQAERRGDMDWLRDTTFFPASCFDPPTNTTCPRAWERIAVPTALLRRGDHKIYKRVSTKPVADSQYCRAIAELESQSFGERKRARTEKHTPPYGKPGFGRELAPEITGEEELATARVQVKHTLESIWKDNQSLRNRCRGKRSTFDPAQLAWVPRKRHNTRWPINPPQENAEQIAPLQPLIKFELHPSQIDEVMCLAQHEKEPQQSPGRVPEPREPAQQVQNQKSARRRRTIRPSLSTILEDVDETLAFPVLTPGTGRRIKNASPTKRWSAASEKNKTPTKVAESPLKNFTINATPEMTPADHHITMLSSPIIPPSAVDGAPELDHQDYFTVPSTPVSKVVTTKLIERTAAFITTDETAGTIATTVAVFDQPIPNEQQEPEHESKRRISLDAARRTDRRSDVRIIKRAFNLVAGNRVGGIKRRHSDMSHLHKQLEGGPSRRRTLDIDVGRTLDIFSQPVKESLGQIQAKENPTVLLSGERILTEGVQQDRDGGFESGTERNRCSPETGGKNGDSEAEPLQVTPEKVIPEEAILEEATPEEAPPQGIIPQEATPHVENIDGDSDLADLRNFVQRAKSKGRKDVEDTITPAFVAKKRRSGSMSSATSDSGSPIAKREIPTTTSAAVATASPRVPLAAKDPNKSPSPSKKRKLGMASLSSSPAKKPSSRLVIPDLDDNEPAAKPRKRRRGMESDTDDIFNPEMGLGQDLTQRGVGGGDGARRSSRIAKGKKTRPAATTISVRMPGAGPGIALDFDVPAVSTAGVTAASRDRKFAKDLAAETRANTSKNKGGALPVSMALTAMALIAKGDNVDDDTTESIPVPPRPGAKGVRWAEVLAQVQGEEDGAAAESEQEVQQNEVAVEEDKETVLPSPPQLRSVKAARPNRPSNPVGDQLAQPDDDKEQQRDDLEALEDKSENQQPKRLTRSGSAASRLPTRANGTPAKKSALPAPPSRIAKAASAGSGGGKGRGGASAAAIARLGMAGPGTPGPRRRARVGRLGSS